MIIIAWEHQLNINCEVRVGVFAPKQADRGLIILL